MTSVTTETRPALGPRPEPHLIRFDRDCFEAAGTEIEYSVGLSAPSYPRKFGTDKAAAEAFAKRTNRHVTETARTIWRRVKWC